MYGETKTGRKKKSEKQVGGEIFPGVQGVTWSSTVLELHVIVAVRGGMQSALWHLSFLTQVASDHRLPRGYEDWIVTGMVCPCSNPRLWIRCCFTRTCNSHSAAIWYSAKKGWVRTIRPSIEIKFTYKQAKEGTKHKLARYKSLVDGLKNPIAIISNA